MTTMYDSWKVIEPDDHLPQCDWCNQEFEPAHADSRLCPKCGAEADEDQMEE